MTQGQEVRKIPVQTQTVDMKTGKVIKTETTHATIMPAHPGTCPECGTAHRLEEPHNRQSLHYQYTFYAQHNRWPTWADAMAHCSDELRAIWTEALTKHGIDVTGPQKGGAA